MAQKLNSAKKKESHVFHTLITFAIHNYLQSPSSECWTDKTDPRSHDKFLILLCCGHRYYLTQKLLLGTVEDFHVQQDLKH